MSVKRIVEDCSEASGLENLLGENVEIWCLNYIYAGKLVSVSDAEVCLEGGGIVYETGGLNASSYQNFQAFGANRHVCRGHIESYGISLKVPK